MASKFTSPLLGYNNNVRHKNRVFHIQTEDSGIKHPHIITHLFMDGGRILKSVKKSYAEHIGVDGMTDIVKGMMKEQHKAMFIALRDGQFDHVVEGNAAAAAPVAAAAPAPAHATATAPEVPLAASSELSIADVDPDAPENAPADALALADAAPSTPPDEEAASSPTIALPAPNLGHDPIAARGPSGAAPKSTPPVHAQSPGLELDMDALKRASHDDGASTPFRSPSDLPPPPENLFRDRPATGGYRDVTSPAERSPGSTRPRPPSVPAMPRPAPRPPGPGMHSSTRSTSDPPRRQAPPPPPAPGESRYAPTRPAAIFSAPRNTAPVAPTSIFGGDLLSDKSLDEVILSYLAEDLEPEPSKK